jgi:hypothetical protein
MCLNNRIGQPQNKPQPDGFNQFRRDTQEIRLETSTLDWLERPPHRVSEV